MPLVKQLLQLQIEQAFVKLSSGKYDTAQAQKELAKDLATAIDSYIKSATITVPPGTLVVTAGTPAAQTGSTTTPTIATIM